MIVSWAAGPRQPGATIVRLRAAESCLPLAEHRPRCRCKLRRVSPPPIRKGQRDPVATWTRWRPSCPRDRRARRRPMDKCRLRHLAGAARLGHACLSRVVQAILPAVRRGRLRRSLAGMDTHPLPTEASPPERPVAPVSAAPAPVPSRDRSVASKVRSRAKNSNLIILAASAGVGMLLLAVAIAVIILSKKPDGRGRQVYEPIVRSQPIAPVLRPSPETFRRPLRQLGPHGPSRSSPRALRQPRIPALARPTR